MTCSFKNIFIEEKCNKNINQKHTEWISTVFGPIDKILVLTAGLKLECVTEN